MAKKEGVEVIVIGSALQDLFVISNDLRITKTKVFASGYAEMLELGSKNEAEDVIQTTGGGATNAAATFAKLDFKTGLFAEIGDDTGGIAMHAMCTELGIRDFLHKEKGAKTGLSVIIAKNGADRSILIYRGASDAISLAHFPLETVAPKWFYVTTLHGNVAGMRHVIDRAQEIGARICWNPGSHEISLGIKKLQPLLESVHILLLNREEAAELTRTRDGEINSLLKKLSGLPEYLCLTDGANGAWFASANEVWRAESMKVKVVNTTGAGDAFGSGLVAGFMKYHEPVKALQLAMLNATSVIQHLGAKTGLLTKWPSERDLGKVRISTAKA